MKLDLHGKSHYDISSLIDKFIWSAMQQNKSEIEIVTGNSKRMKDLTIQVIKEYNLDYKIGDVVNQGYIIVYLK